MKKPSASLWKSVRLGIFILLGLVIYAYGFQVTKVDLGEFRKESRQESRIRVTRALARPDIFEYQQEEITVYAPVYIPCQSTGFPFTQPDQTKPYLVLTPACGNVGEDIHIEGFNFPPNLKGPLYFVPSADPADKLALQKGNFQTDATGHFILDFKLPDRSSGHVQYIRVIARRNVGLPHFSPTAVETWNKILETIFLALLATTIGTIFSIPISFFAARNLMKDVKNSLTQISLALLGLPLGIAGGMVLARWMSWLSKIYQQKWTVTFGLAILCMVVGIVLIRYVLFHSDNRARLFKRINIPKILQFLAIIILLQGLFFVSQFGIIIGKWITPHLGYFAFLGNFITQLSDVILTILPAVLAVSGGAVSAALFGNIGRRLNERLPLGSLKLVNYLASMAAGAVLMLVLGGVIGWLYEINNVIQIRIIPAGLGVIAGSLLAAFTKPRQPFPIGLAVYTITRTILNAVRSIEALIMAIVAVIWVGIGPFAGVLALGLHTIASLAKLYSEQVESILPGPLEAITATGATRLQTIVYAVIPQIIPPYISFTMYRWDINVRMSTIIGFAGGGGIGFLLIQNINLLNYRAASTQMLAIAIVVAAMDYFSSWMREKFV
ncbi:MAG: ABC transporter permease subunit [Anaerolineales bacterium]